MKIRRIIFSFLFTFFASGLCFALPETVNFKTKEQTTDGHYSTALREGRIWIKKRVEPLKKKPFYDIYENTMKVDDSWRLFNKTGLPRGLGFSGPKKIISIEADGDTLIAIDEKGLSIDMVIVSVTRVAQETLLNIGVGAISGERLSKDLLSFLLTLYGVLAEIIMSRSTTSILPEIKLILKVVPYSYLCPFP